MLPCFGGGAGKFSVLSLDSEKKGNRERKGRDYCVGPGGPVTGPGGWFGDGPVVPVMAMLADRPRLNRNAKTAPVPASTATGMNKTGRNPTLLAHWRYARCEECVTILCP